VFVPFLNDLDLDRFLCHSQKRENDNAVPEAFNDNLTKAEASSSSTRCVSRRESDNYQFAEGAAGASGVDA
jgi:hypothetical protein